MDLCILERISIVELDSFGKNIGKGALPFYIGLTKNMWNRVGINHCREGQQDNMFKSLLERRDYFHKSKKNITPEGKLKSKLVQVSDTLNIYTRKHFEDSKKKNKPGEEQNVKRQLKDWVLRSVNEARRYIDCDCSEKKGKTCNHIHNATKIAKEIVNEDYINKDYINKVKDLKAKLKFLKDRVLEASDTGLDKGKIGNIKTSLSEVIKESLKISESIYEIPPYLPMEKYDILKRGHWTFINLDLLPDSNTIREKKLLDDDGNPLDLDHLMMDFEGYAIDRVNKMREASNCEKLLNKAKLTWKHPSWYTSLNQTEKDKYESIYLSWLTILLNGDLYNCDELFKPQLDVIFDCQYENWIYAFWSEERNTTDTKTRKNERINPYYLTLIKDCACSPQDKKTCNHAFTQKIKVTSMDEKKVGDRVYSISREPT